MKMVEKKIYVTFIIVLLFFGTLQVSSSHLIEYTEQDPEKETYLEINSDQELKDLAQEQGLDGAGTEDDPYVLSDWELDGGGNNPGIYLSDIELHLLVKNCKIHNSSAPGIFLFQVSNLTMEDNDIKDVGTGLFIEDSHDNHFFSNDFSDVQNIGVEIKGSSMHNSFYENSFESRGIYLNVRESSVGSQYIPVNNTIGGEPIHYLKGEDEEVFTAEKIGQLMIADSSSIEVENAVIPKGSIGLTVIHSENISVKNVTIEGQTKAGMYLRGVKNVSVESSRIAENHGDGLNVYSSKNITITDNLIERSGGYGITIEESIDVGIYLNALRWNRMDSYVRSGSFPSQAKEDERSSSIRWNSTHFGNHWSPWNTTARDRSGVMTEAYEIEQGAKDHHPLSSMIGPPVDISVQPRDGAVILNWSEPRYSIFEPFSHVKIYRGSEEDNVSLYKETGAETRGIVDENVSNDETYHYGLIASNQINSSFLSPLVRVRPDGTLPRGVEYSPKGEEVAVDSTITVIFSEDMLEDTVNISVKGVSGNLTGGGSTYHFEPEGDLNYGETYRVEVRGKDTARNRLEGGSMYWTFTTTSAATVRGKIISADGEPIEGAVIVSESGGHNITDSTGTFEMKLEYGESTLVINREGYFEKEVNVETGPGEEIDIGVIEMEKEGGEGKISRWLWPMLIFTFAVILLGILASLVFLRRLKDRDTVYEEDAYEEDSYEDLTQEEFDTWWDEED